MAMVALVMIAGCIHASASLYPKDPPAIRVTVREGDTLWKYAAKYGSKDRYMLSSVEEIARVNNLEKSRAIQPGMQLLIPR
jgi:LysM repeat protein